MKVRLQAELQDRTLQYNYYRDKLLSEGYLNKITKNVNILQNTNKELIFTTLGRIGEIQMCKRILKEQTSYIGDVPFYKIGTFGKDADSFISKKLFDDYKKKYNYPQKGEILLSASGTIGKCVIFDGQDAYFQDSNIVWLSHNEKVVLNEYLYYFYQVVDWNPSRGGTISRLYNYNLENMKIMLPSIDIQKEIIRILNKFQDILKDTEGLLPTEIEQRQKQYEYYREKLLTFGVESGTASQPASQPAINFTRYYEILKEAADIVGVDLSCLCCRKSLDEIGEILGGVSGKNKADFINNSNFVADKNVCHSTEVRLNEKVEWKKISEIFTITRGRVISKEYLNAHKGKYPVYSSQTRNNGEIGQIDTYDYDGEYLTWTTDGAYAGTVFYRNEKFSITNVCGLLRRKTDKVISKFICYWLQIEAKKYVKDGSGNPKLMSNIMADIRVPVPSIETQEKIVEILENFEKITTSIQEGIPRVIELRQMQYEYYREKLLSFKR